MLYVENPSLDPYFNLAAEEYLLKKFDHEVIMLWRSFPSVIVGKHQNTLAEINLNFVKLNNIPVIRRLSGGGTVFHDPGNINFTFIRRVAREKMVDFRWHVAPILDFLQSKGIDARFEGKNDLRVDGLKFSGNAEHVFKDKVLHHGTLLFKADLNWLNEAIKSKEPAFESKAVKSVRSIVTNLGRYFDKDLDAAEFQNMLRNYLLGFFGNVTLFEFGEGDIIEIDRLVKEKYTTWDWNFGYSPAYSFRNEGVINGVRIELTIHVSKGLIENTLIKALDGVLKTDHLEDLLRGTKHNPEEMENTLKKDGFFNENKIKDPWSLLKLFF